MKTEAEKLFETLDTLKKEGYITLLSLAAEDLSPNQNGEDEFRLIYTLYNPGNKEFQEVETTTNAEIDSVSRLFKSANYDEREVYDLFGVKFKNHPNLVRIFLDDNFEGHPLRNGYKGAKTSQEADFR